MATRWLFARTDCEQFFSSILQSQGYSDDEARSVFDVSLWAHRFNRHTHSFAKWLDLWKHILQPGGTCVPGRAPRVVRGGGKAVEVWDGNCAVGPMVASMMLRRAIELARTYGIGEVRCGGMNHYLCGAYYCYLGAKDGMWIETTCTSAFGFEGVLEGGRRGNTGTNPITRAMMVGPDRMCMDDKATTALAMGFVHKLRRENAGRQESEKKKLPPDTFLDEHGNFTDDPDKARMVRCFGGAKGSGENMAIEFDHAVLGGSPAIYRGRPDIPAGEVNTAMFIFRARNPADCSATSFPNGRTLEENIAFCMDELIRDNGNARIPGADRIRQGEDLLLAHGEDVVLLREEDLRDFAAISRDWDAASLGVDFEKFELREVSI